MKRKLQLIVAIAIVTCLSLFTSALIPDEKKVSFAPEYRPRMVDQKKLSSFNYSSAPLEILQAIEKCEYNISWQQGAHSYQSPNRATNLRFTYFKNGFRVQPRTINIPVLNEKFSLEEESAYNTIDDWKVDMSLKNFGRDDVTEKFNGSDFTVVGNAAYIEDERMKIEYLNNKEGMRQNFIIKESPEGNGQLQLNIVTTTDLRVSVADNVVSFATSNGEPKMQYRDLKVWDAKNTILEANMLSTPDGFKIVVNDENAEYPITIDPLSKPEDWVYNGSQADMALGRSITSGYINGDLFVDVVVGASQYDNGQIDEGALFVFYGSASGLLTTPVILESNVANAKLGYSVAVGNVNGDIRSDVIGGAPYYSNGQTNEGAIFIFYSTVSGVAGNNPPASLIKESGQTGALMGWDVANGGDVNQDGYIDIMVGAPRWESTHIGPGNEGAEVDEGAAFGFYGSATGISPTATDWLQQANTRGAQFGFSVSSAGDVNGDAIGDVIIGAPYYHPNATTGQRGRGRVFLFAGSGGVGLQNPLGISEGAEYDYLGWEVCKGGDVNADGRTEFVFTAPGSIFQNSAGAFFYGYYNIAAGFISASRISATLPGIGLGSTVTAGDIDNDGKPEVIVGAPYYDNVETDEGAIFIYKVNSITSVTLTPWRTESNTVNGFLGAENTLCYLGDVNGDSYGDFAIGNPLIGNGSLYIYHGSSNILPVTLLNFNAEKKEQKVALTWQTASEQNNKGFEVQRWDGTKWLSLGFVQGAGNSNTLQNYNYSDFPGKTGSFQYRLKQVDFDGKFNYSNIVLVKFNSHGFSVNVYPNPVREQLTVQYKLEKTEKVKLKVLDAGGKLVRNVLDITQSPGTYQKTINASSLPKGSYYCKLTVGDEIQTHRFQVQ